MNIDALIKEIKAQEGIKNDKDLARLLEISAQNFCNRRKRGTLRPLLIEHAVRRGLAIRLKDSDGESRLVQQDRIVDVELLQDVIERADEAMARTQGLSAKKRARLYAALYEMSVSGIDMTDAHIEHLINLAS